MNLDQSLKDAWTEHGDAPQAVADRLPALSALVQTDADLARWVHLALHLWGEHLGQWDVGMRCFGQLRASPLCQGDGAGKTAAHLARAIATLKLASGATAGEGDSADVAADVNVGGLPLDDQAHCYASVAAIHAGRHYYPAAAAALAQALAIVDQGIAPDAPAHRALAVAGNNLAVELQELPTLDAQQQAALLLAGQTGLRFWTLAGGWLEQERAEYQLTRCHLKLAQFEKAIESAERCLQVCAAHEAPVFERFFGHAVLALACQGAGHQSRFAAQRDLALALWRTLPTEDQVWCKREFDELSL